MPERKTLLQGLSDKHLLKEKKMGRTLLIIGLTLLVLWLLGFITSYTLGGGIHILLAVAIIMIIISLVSGRRVK